MSYVRALPALLVLILFPVIVVAAVSVLLALIIVIAALTHSGVLAYVVVFALVGMLGGLGYAARELWTARSRRRIEGPELTRRDASELWAMVDELARHIRTRPVDRIIVVAVANAGVAQVRGERVLLIGYPLLLGYTRAELRATLAHELGHFAGGRFALASSLRRVQDAVVAVARNSSGVWHSLFKAYAKLYIRAAGPSLRSLEHAADGFSIRLAGSEATASSFEKDAVMSVLSDTLFGTYVPAYFETSGARAPLGEGLERIHDANEAVVTERAREIVWDGASQWFDTHPPTSERIARARARAVVTPEGQHGPAHQLLPMDFDRIEAALVGMPETELLDWDTVIARGCAVHVERVVSRILHELTDKGVLDRPTVRCAMLANLRAPLTKDIAGDVPDLTEQNVRLARHLLNDAMVRSGRAWFVDDWSRAPMLWGPQGRIDQDQLVGNAGPAATNRLLDLLDAWGVDLDYVPVRVEPPIGEQSTDQLLYAMTCATRGVRRLHDVLVFAQGVLVVRYRGSRFALLAGAGREDRQLERLLRRLGPGLDQLRSEKSAIWVPVEQLVELNVRSRWSTKGRLELRVAGRARSLIFDGGDCTHFFGGLGDAPSALRSRVTTGKEHEPLPQSGSPMAAAA